MSWLDESYMARKGVAKGKAGATHQLTEAKQGKYHYVYGPYAEPGAAHQAGRHRGGRDQGRVRGGDQDRVDDKPTELLHMPFLNPQCGPIAVEGAEKGDVLAVHIHSIKPRGPQPVGTTALIPEFGGLVGTAHTALLNEPLAGAGEEDGGHRAGHQVQQQDHAALRAVHRHARRQSPEIEAITSLQPDY